MGLGKGMDRMGSQGEGEERSGRECVMGSVPRQGIGGACWRFLDNVLFLTGSGSQPFQPKMSFARYNTTKSPKCLQFATGLFTAFHFPLLSRSGSQRGSELLRGGPSYVYL